MLLQIHNIRFCQVCCEHLKINNQPFFFYKRAFLEFFFPKSCLKVGGAVSCSLYLSGAYMYIQVFTVNSNQECLIITVIPHVVVHSLSKFPCNLCYLLVCSSSKENFWNPAKDDNCQSSALHLITVKPVTDKLYEIAALPVCSKDGNTRNENHTKDGLCPNVFDFSQDDTQKFSSTLSDFNFYLLLNFLFKTWQKHKSAVERHALGTFLCSKLTSNFLIWHHSCSYHQGIICLFYHCFQLWLEKCSPLLCLLSTPWSILEAHNSHLRLTLQGVSGHASFQMMTVAVEAMSIARIFFTLRWET